MNEESLEDTSELEGKLSDQIKEMLTLCVTPKQVQLFADVLLERTLTLVYVRAGVKEFNDVQALVDKTRDDVSELCQKNYQAHISKG